MLHFYFLLDLQLHINIDYIRTVAPRISSTRGISNWYVDQGQKYSIS